MKQMFSRASKRSSPQLNNNVNNTNNVKYIMPIKYYSNPVNALNGKKIEEESKPILPKMTWGEPTWYFLHCLAEKIKENEYSSKKDDILKIIYSICTNLPCPYCSNHAKIYLNKINFNTIDTKEELKKMLYMFHNNINSTKSYPLFSENQLHSKYKSMDFYQVINNFIYTFEKSGNGGGLKLSTENMFRKNVLKEVKQWIRMNLQHFDR